jgi:hypothetical protein
MFGGEGGLNESQNLVGVIGSQIQAMRSENRPTREFLKRLTSDNRNERRSATQKNKKTKLAETTSSKYASKHLTSSVFP